MNVQHVVGKLKQCNTLKHFIVHVIAQEPHLRVPTFWGMNNQPNLLVILRTLVCSQPVASGLAIQKNAV